MELMQMIKGITFAPFSRRGKLDTKSARASLRNLKKLTGANLIILVPNGLQETPQSETIARETQANATDEEFLSIIEYAHSLGLSVALKPTVNCMNGTWRAHISFFDKDVPCEPKWSNWFASYTAFQLHYAALAEKSGCEMFIAGCEMVMSEHRDAEWRKLISDIKEVYHGPVSYNTDKYQEDNVTWWDWCIRGEAAPDEQASWYKAMFEACKKRPFVRGFCIWDWAAKQYPLSGAASNTGYEIYGKPALEVVHHYYKEMN